METEPVQTGALEAAAEGQQGRRIAFPTCPELGREGETGQDIPHAGGG